MTKIEEQAFDVIINKDVWTEADKVIIKLGGARIYEQMRQEVKNPDLSKLGDAEYNTQLLFLKSKLEQLEKIAGLFTEEIPLWKKVLRFPHSVVTEVRKNRLEDIQNSIAVELEKARREAAKYEKQKYRLKRHGVDVDALHQKINDLEDAWREAQKKLKEKEEAMKAVKEVKPTGSANKTTGLLLGSIIGTGVAGSTAYGLLASQKLKSENEKRQAIQQQALMDAAMKPAPAPQAYPYPYRNPTIAVLP